MLSENVLVDAAAAFDLDVARLLLAVSGSRIVVLIVLESREGLTIVLDAVVVGPTLLLELNSEETVLEDTATVDVGSRLSHIRLLIASPSKPTWYSTLTSKASQFTSVEGPVGGFP